MITPRIFIAILGGLLGLAGVISAVLLLTPDEPFVAPPGSVATSEAEQSLLELHGTFGTPNITNERMQRAIIDAARTLCDQLDRGVMTPQLWTTIGEQEGVESASTVTSFAIAAMCPQHEK